MQCLRVVFHMSLTAQSLGSMEQTWGITIYPLICIHDDKLVANANRMLLCGIQDSYPGEGEIHCRLLQKNLAELKNPEKYKWYSHTLFCCLGSHSKQI